MRIDSHQHFWNYDPGQYPWIKPEWPIRRSYLPEALGRRVECHARLDGCVAVQARQSLEESSWLLELADRSRFIKGVVGWVDLRAPDVAGQLGQLAAHPKFVGVRHVLQDEPDDDFMLERSFQRGISQLRQFDLKYDLLIFPRQLPAAIQLASAHPRPAFCAGSYRKTADQRGTDGSLARAYSETGRSAQCLVQSFRADHRSRLAALAAGPLPAVSRCGLRGFWTRIG